MTDHLRAAFSRQSTICGAMGSAFMEQLMGLCAERLDLTRGIGLACKNWPGDPGVAGDILPLRLAGALHFLVLNGSAPDLAAIYPPQHTADDDLWRAVSKTLTQYEQQILEFLKKAPQTNEIRRAAAVIAGILWALERTGPLPLTLSEMGASAGLNLNLDLFALKLGPQSYGPQNSPIVLEPDWRGDVRPPAPQKLDVMGKAGVDLEPLNPNLPDDQLRLFAYLWPDQTERLERTKAAISLAPPPVDKGDAANWLAGRLARPWTGLHVVYTTIAEQYFSAETKAHIRQALDQYGQKANQDAALLHLALESDGKIPGAGLTASLWAGGRAEHWHLARCDFHLAWMDWAPKPVQTKAMSDSFGQAQRRK